VRLKALSVRFWGIPEGVNLLLVKTSKSLANIVKKTVPMTSFFFL